MKKKRVLHTDESRRRFIGNSVKVASAMVLAGLTIPASGAKKEYTVQDVIDLLLRQYTGDPITDTVDTIKVGDSSRKVTGIICTMFPTIAVIEEAASRKANFIIAHEPVFYNHRDDQQWVADNEVVRRKKELLEQHSITVWRFHDYCHGIKPDMVNYGFALKAGWVNFQDKTDTFLYNIPASHLANITRHLKSVLGAQKVRVIGDPALPCRKVLVLPGAWGGQRQVSLLLKHRPDVLVVGETAEWETVELVRDATKLGWKTSLIVLGHSLSEDPGMKWTAEWLAPRLNGIPVSHIESGDPFRWE